mgnify:CR=1 FL=1
MELQRASPQDLNRLHEFITHFNTLDPFDRYRAQLDMANDIANARHSANELVEQFYDYVVRDGSWRQAGVSEIVFNENFAPIKEMAEAAKAGRNRHQEARAAIEKSWGPKTANIFPHLTSSTGLSALRGLARKGLL